MNNNPSGGFGSEREVLLNALLQTSGPNDPALVRARAEELDEVYLDAEVRNGPERDKLKLAAQGVVAEFGLGKIAGIAALEELNKIKAELHSLVAKETRAGGRWIVSLSARAYVWVEAMEGSVALKMLEKHDILPPKATK